MPLEGLKSAIRTDLNGSLLKKELIDVLRANLFRCTRFQREIVEMLKKHVGKWDLERVECTYIVEQTRGMISVLNALTQTFDLALQVLTFARDQQDPEK